MERTQLGKPRMNKRFYFITALIFLPILYALTVIHAHWWGFVLAAAAFAMLMWMRFALPWRGLVAPACMALAFLLALGGLYVSRPERDVSLQGQIARETLRLFMRLPVDESIRSGEVFSERASWEAPEGYALETVQLPHCAMEVLRAEGTDIPRGVLQLHGGAFEAGLNDMYRMMALRYSTYGGQATVATPDYRLWPGHGYPAQQQDAMDAWLYLVDSLGLQPEHILVVGDSAGGNLALSLCLRLREEGRPLPRAIICMSPWADLSNSGPSHIENATQDPTFGVAPGDYDGVTPVGVSSTYADQLDPQDPMVSPSFGEYRGFPPMLLQASSDEVLLSDSQMVHDNAVGYGVDCTLSIYKGMFHVFQGSLSLLPESNDAWEEVEAFVRAQLGT